MSPSREANTSPLDLMLIMSVTLWPPGHVAVVPDLGVTEHVGQLLGHQGSDLVHGGAELQVAQVQPRGQLLPAAPVVRQLLLHRRHNPEPGGLDQVVWTRWSGPGGLNQVV